MRGDLRRKPAWPHPRFLLLLLSLALTPAHATDLTGKITNAQGGEPLGKVHISVAGTPLAAVTAGDGTFRIPNAPTGALVLQVSAVGYRTISVPFDSPAEGSNQIKDFAISLLPDNFQRTEKVEVHADIFQSPEWPSVGDMTLTSSELQQTSTVLINDPFRALQTLPGVSGSANNDLFAQFSVMGSRFENVGIYVDDVYVPNLLHRVPGEPDAPTLSLLTGGDVADMHLLPVAYPVRYADAAGAAVVIRTREGDPSPPLIHALVGMATSEFLGQGAFGPQKKATWLLGARKSYIGYLERYFASTRFSEDGFYDANLKLTYALTPSQTLSLYATGGELGILDPHPPPLTSVGFGLVRGNTDLALARLGWKWAANPKLLLSARGAFVRSGTDQDFLSSVQRNLSREWSVGADISWNWHHGAILQSGYSLRRPRVNFSGVVRQPPPPVFFSDHFTDVRQDFYIQNSLQFWRNRVRLQGGLRWSKLNTERVQPVTGQVSISYRAASNTTLEAAWGRYAQLPARGGISSGSAHGTFELLFAGLPYDSSQFIVAVEHRMGERTRLRFEVFERQNESRGDFFAGQVSLGEQGITPLLRSALVGNDYSRGIQVTLQRRSENRLSGWIGYTFTQARARSYQIELPPPVGVVSTGFPYAPTEADQPHTVNLFGSYRLTPSIRLSAKGLYGSGFPVNGSAPTSRIGPYERLDLRADKSWSFKRWKLSLYTELLNATAHNNRRFGSYSYDPVTQQTTIFTNPGFPILPTASLGFDF